MACGATTGKISILKNFIGTDQDTPPHNARNLQASDCKHLQRLYQNIFTRRNLCYVKGEVLIKI
ncbi:hypothetical protein C4K03_2245 [Pseudomonas synxantha]|uniref:Uncharacterized protein n=1 Tax=Pseudomonas synxantha TaxID=47883 RepID=A0A3G7U5D9_9PSED|nr:hypothetical protein C4K03_2245 [Pseudomonas synxantha]